MVDRTNKLKISNTSPSQREVARRSRDGGLEFSLHRIIATLTTKPVIAALAIVALLATTTSAIAMVVSIAAGYRDTARNGQ